MPFDKCPNCGYTDKPNPKHHHAVMNEYVNSETKASAIFNHDEEKFETTSGEGDTKKTVTWIRKDVFAKIPPAKALAGATPPSVLPAA